MVEQNYPFFFRSPLARRSPRAAWIFFEWLVTWLKRPITCRLSRRFALGHVIIITSYFSVKVAWFLRKLIKLSAVFWKLLSAGFRSECEGTEVARNFSLSSWLRGTGSMIVMSYFPILLMGVSSVLLGPLIGALYSTLGMGNWFVTIYSSWFLLVHKTTIRGEHGIKP